MGLTMWPNRVLELTATRRAITFQMIKTLLVEVALAGSGVSSAWSREMVARLLSISLVVLLGSASLSTVRCRVLAAALGMSLMPRQRSGSQLLSTASGTRLRGNPVQDRMQPDSG